MFVSSEQKSGPGSATKKPSGSSSKAGGRKGQRKDDEWEEVSRKYVSSLNCLFIYLSCHT